MDGIGRHPLGWTALAPDRVGTVTELYVRFCADMAAKTGISAGIASASVEIW